MTKTATAKRKQKTESFELQALRATNKHLSDEYDKLFALTLEMAKELELIRDNIQLVSAATALQTSMLFERWRKIK